MHNLTYTAKDPFVPKDRWIVSLSNGTTVFQNKLPGQRSAWIRLRQFVEKESLRFSNVRLQAFGHVITMPPWYEVRGYWFMEGARTFLNMDRPEEYKMGLGYIKGTTIYVTWVFNDGHTEIEERDLEDPKMDNMRGAVIHEV